VTEQTAPDVVAVFIMSRATTPKLLRVLWLMSEADARKVCNDPRTAGRNFGLHWTAEYGKQGEDWDYTPDNGRWNGLLAELGVTLTGARDEQQRLPVLLHEAAGRHHVAGAGVVAYRGERGEAPAHAGRGGCQLPAAGLPQGAGRGLAQR
jgi:hypothetical protein